MFKIIIDKCTARSNTKYTRNGDIFTSAHLQILGLYLVPPLPVRGARISSRTVCTFSVAYTLFMFIILLFMRNHYVTTKKLCHDNCLQIFQIL